MYAIGKDDLMSCRVAVSHVQDVQDEVGIFYQIMLIPLSMRGMSLFHSVEKNARM
jgi:hypothetical protein